LIHRGINQKWSEGCLIVVPERFTLPDFSYTNSNKVDLEEESQQEVDKLINYIREKEIFLKKKYEKDKVDMKIIIKQENEIQD
jgi:hypothetical protein